MDRYSYGSQKKTSLKRIKHLQSTRKWLNQNTDESDRIAVSSVAKAHVLQRYSNLSSVII